MNHIVYIDTNLGFKLNIIENAYMNHLENKTKFNVSHSNVNLSPLAISCSRVPLVHDRVYCLRVGGP